MRRSRILEERRKRVSPEIRESVALSFRIVDRIHDILQEKGLKQKDLALRLGKSEAEISKWMRGTHNFTIDVFAHHTPTCFGVRGVRGATYFCNSYVAHVCVAKNRKHLEVHTSKSDSDNGTTTVAVVIIVCCAVVSKHS